MSSQAEHDSICRPHQDFFGDKQNINRGGQRTATVLMYLTDVEEGALLSQQLQRSRLRACMRSRRRRRRPNFVPQCGRADGVRRRTGARHGGEAAQGRRGVVLHDEAGREGGLGQHPRQLRGGQGREVERNNLVRAHAVLRTQLQRRQRSFEHTTVLRSCAAAD